MATQAQLREQLVKMLVESEGRLSIIEAIVSGELPQEQLKALGGRLYAEARAALQVKIPERIRLCPLEAGAARRFWWKILAEESGDFEPGQDHASLLARVCVAFGMSQQGLDSEYEDYLPRLDAIRQEPPSIGATLREMTRMYIEEAVFAREAGRIADSLRDHYEISENALYYFRLHTDMDVEHSNAALDQIILYAKTPELQHVVINTAKDSLERFPIWAWPQRTP